MSAVLIDPSPAWDAVAARLRPLAVDGTVSAPLTSIINAVTAVVEELAADAFTESERSARHRDRLLEEVLGLRARAAELEAAHERQMADTKEGARRAVEQNVAGIAQRAAHFAALQHVHVQAKARWDHEGGPQVLRDAIRAAEVTA